MREYYPLNVVFDGKDHYCVWFTNYTSGFITEGNRIIVYPSLGKLKAFAKQKGIELCDEEEPIGEGALTIYPEINDPTFNNSPGCNYYIRIWNTADDIANTLNIPFSGKSGSKSMDDIYDKLFRGCNLPAVTPEGKNISPYGQKQKLAC